MDLVDELHVSADASEPILEYVHVSVSVRVERLVELAYLLNPLLVRVVDECDDDVYGIPAHLQYYTV
jgi:hypothetical protein